MGAPNVLIVLLDPTTRERVHDINHVGRYFSVRGPRMCEPRPQRTPVIYQAGQSPREIEFGAQLPKGC